MKYFTPTILSRAVSNGSWRDPGPDALRRIFSLVAELSDLRLFPDLNTMAIVQEQVRQSGYIDDPQFCMVLDETRLKSASDPRLVFSSAMFIGGSIIPGDDVLVALDLRRAEPPVLVFDWTKPMPSRWVDTGCLSEFITQLGEN